MCPVISVASTLLSPVCFLELDDFSFPGSIYFDVHSGRNEIPMGGQEHRVIVFWEVGQLSFRNDWNTNNTVSGDQRAIPWPLLCHGFPVLLWASHCLSLSYILPCFPKNFLHRTVYSPWHISKLQDPIITPTNQYHQEMLRLLFEQLNPVCELQNHPKAP